MKTTILICFLSILQLVPSKFIVTKFESSGSTKGGPKWDLSTNLGDTICENEAYPPPKSDLVPTYEINLDDAPKDRWSKLISDKKKPLKKLVNYVQKFAVELLGENIFKMLNTNLPKLTQSLPSPFKEEIYGIAAAGDLTVTQATLYNIFYEVFSMCTSIVAQDTQGKLYHARNLDFGLLMGWDRRNHTWRVSEMLGPLVVQMRFMRNGKEVFQSASYAGFVGVLTAVKKDKFTFSLDERFTLNGGYIGLLEWIIWRDYDQQWVSFLSRSVMETSDTYEEAVDALTTSRLVAPVYFIVAGNKPGQGILITRGRDDANLLRLGAAKQGQASWFLVETNYDHWDNPPFYDNRRGPAIKCLNELSPNNISHGALYNVLSTKPIINKLTTYTSLMDVEKGLLGTWLRTCPNPCPPW